ncbi:MAG: hypothetical protein OHK0029_25720 [Armatimonadaceae bacterium]
MTSFSSVASKEYPGEVQAGLPDNFLAEAEKEDNRLSIWGGGANRKEKAPTLQEPGLPLQHIHIPVNKWREKEITSELYNRLPSPRQNNFKFFIISQAIIDASAMWEYTVATQ